jgi:hypothetical protein
MTSSSLATKQRRHVFVFIGGSEVILPPLDGVG